MLNRIKKTLVDYSMFTPGERVVVGVSGGPDSICLLYLLKQLDPQLCLDLCVAHFDHALRKDSSKDRLFVEKVAHQLCIPFFCGRLEKKKIKKRVMSEELLKKHRYDFLLKVCKKTNSKKIALGHTQDDQAETVLMRILRGSGLYGLSAILPKRCLDSCVIVRPLIEISRLQVLHFLSEKKIPYRVDGTNLENLFLRNRIRNKLLPLLEHEYNPNLKKVLADLALNVGADYHYLYDQAQVFLKKHLKRYRRGFYMDLPTLKKTDVSLRRLFLRLVIEMLTGGLRALTFQHAQEMEDLLFLKTPGSQLHLPGDVVLLKEKNRLLIFRR